MTDEETLLQLGSCMMDRYLATIAFPAITMLITKVLEGWSFPVCHLLSLMSSLV